MFQLVLELLLCIGTLYFIYRLVYPAFRKIELDEKAEALKHLEQDYNLVTQLQKDHENVDQKVKQVNEFTNK